MRLAEALLRRIPYATNQRLADPGSRAALARAQVGRHAPTDDRYDQWSGVSRRRAQTDRRRSTRRRAEADRGAQLAPQAAPGDLFHPGSQRRGIPVPRAGGGFRIVSSSSEARAARMELVVDAWAALQSELETERDRHPEFADVRTLLGSVYL